MYTKVYSRKHTRLSDSQTKQTNGGTKGQTCGWADRGKEDEQRGIKTKHKQGRHTYYIYCHADTQIYYNERALTTLKIYTSIAQAGHFN